MSLATLRGVAIALRAPVIALKAVALNLLVAGAAIGATVIVFQDGLVGSGSSSVFPRLCSVWARNALCCGSTRSASARIVFMRPGRHAQS